MPAAADGGGGITVVPPALSEAGARVRAVVGRAREAAASGSATMCIATGSPELDAALSGFDGQWSVTASRISDAGDDLATALSTASIAYTQTDACVIPGGH
jgi:hypothetical protein